MRGNRYHDPAVETLARSDLDLFTDERIRLTARYAREHLPFYHRVDSSSTGRPAGRSGLWIGGGECGRTLLWQEVEIAKRIIG